MKVMRPIIQIAGVMDELEARLLVSAGVDWIGFPLRLDFHQPDLSETDAARIVQSLPAHVRATVITYLTRAEDILALCRKLGAHAVQLHGAVSGTQLARLKQMGSGLFVIKSLIVGAGSASALMQTLKDATPHVDAFLTDTYDPATGASGATGKTHNWQLSRQIVAQSSRPVILAGGLNPENVCQAIDQVRPAGVDAHTGVEGSDGRKDRAKVEAFVAQARNALTRLTRKNQGR